MINFYRWIENRESISEPQHKKGESTMDLDSIVEKRMMQMILELEREGKANRQDILKSIKKTIGDSSNQQPATGEPTEGEPTEGEPTIGGFSG